MEAMSWVVWRDEDEFWMSESERACLLYGLELTCECVISRIFEGHDTLKSSLSFYP